MAKDGFQWDIAKAAANRRKHGVDFAEAAVALDDPLALTMTDPDSNGEERFVSIGSDGRGRLLVTVFAYRGDSIRIISSRPATPSEKRSYGHGR